MPPSQPEDGLPLLSWYPAMLPIMDKRIEDALRAWDTMFGERNWDLVTPYVTPDLVVDWSQSIGPQRGVYHGIDAAREMFESWGEAFSDMSRTTRFARRLGSRVLVQATVAGRGAGSGLETTAGSSGAEILSLQGDRIARVELVQELDDAWRSIRLSALDDARLYFVCDARPRGEDPRPILDAALRGGADIVQLRDPGLDDRELVAAADSFRAAAEEHGALFILNDRPDLVEACRADGVHVGQDDAPVADARRATGPTALVGLSTHSRDEIDDAVSAEGDARPDQISVGPLWETPTKAGRAATGVELASYAAERATEIPWFAIGGIDSSNVDEVRAAGAERIVVVRAIRDAVDPGSAARELRAALTSDAVAARR
jgi:thiamine-phosphate pyrophosphorylase